MTLTVPAWVQGTLMPVEKLEAHRRGLRHKAVSVFVLSGDWVLLQRRAAGKYHTPGLWANACCTHPGWDEAPEACARRRLAEELGVEGLPLVHRGQVEYRADVGGGLIEHEVVEIFTAEAPGRIAPDPNPEEVQETRWTTLAELTEEVRRAPARYTPWLRIYLEEHAQDIFGRVPA
ncbi:isopentenyl-diphosphate Delta-isomerase [Rhodosalinus sediminis]|uniref:Isopentenyl-diphosphate Delta-isomerase n=1 Tax=Rhodosalinus sediminis TaxID=1940533 RepID=A0A3D9BYI2_9RHOB|nr:isopentenyl-diphosphate Delta-isomerase [Rhodosalinus sediminis]REC58603.1 isopentenyl-diphosphate Delta-isomerase [Rhodosalinus sediminis]